MTRHTFNQGNTGNRGNTPAGQGFAPFPALPVAGERREQRGSSFPLFPASKTSRERPKALLHKAVPCVPSVPLDLGDRHAC